MRLPARRLLAITVLLLSIFLCVSSIMELPGTFRNANHNIGNSSFHWSTIGAMLLATVAPIFSVGILLRSRISAYAFLFCALYWLSWVQFFVWLNGGGFRPGQLIGYPLFLMLIASAIYRVRTSRQKDGEAGVRPSWRRISVGSGIAVLVLLAVFRVTLTEPYRFRRNSSRAYSLCSTGDFDDALTILFDMSRRNPDLNYLRGDIGQIYAARDEYEAAITELNIYCDNAVSTEYRNPKYYIDRAYALLKTKKFERAERDFSEAIQLTQKTGATTADTAEFLSYAFLNRGLTRACLGNWAGAEEDYKTVIAYAATDGDVESATMLLKKVRAGAKNSQKGLWQSKHTSCGLRYSDRWSVFRQYDSPGRAMIGLIDHSDGSSVKLTASPDRSLEEYPTEAYLELVKSRMEQSGFMWLGLFRYSGGSYHQYAGRMGRALFSGHNPPLLRSIFPSAVPGTRCGGSEDAGLTEGKIGRAMWLGRQCPQHVPVVR